MSEAGAQICFVDMPFGKKTDPKSGIEIDFDQIYETGIAPAINKAGLKPIRGDREETGGIIHTAMFARLLLAEFVIADMTTANPNVFYELGVRHAAKPYTTIPIFATIGAPPFDVNMVRAIPYDLNVPDEGKEGTLDQAEAENLIDAIAARIDRVLGGPVAEDSPLFHLFPDFPGIEMSHDLTDVFRDRVAYSNEIKDKLAAARSQSPDSAAIAAIREVSSSFGNLKTVERGILVDLLLSYRAVSAFDEMIELFDQMPGDLRESAIPCQQLAFALNRRNGPGDRDRAIRMLEELNEKLGDSAETLGILGRIYKDKFTEAKEANDFAAEGWLDQAIETYTRGFEAEPADYYPGVNAINLLLQKGSEEALREVDRLTPLVTFAVVRRGGEKARDYWTVATVLELACAGRDYRLAARCLPRALALADENWMYETTARNLRLIEELRKGEDNIEQVGRIADALEQAAAGENGGNA